MAHDATQVQYAGNGDVYVAPVGTAMPTDETTVLNASFLDLGYLSEDGVTLSRSIDVNSVMAWQSILPIDRRKASEDVSFSFTCLQINKRTLGLNFGAMTWSVVSAGHFKGVPPAPEVIDYRAFVIHLIDGTDITRILIPKGLLTDPGDWQIRRADPPGMALSIGVINTGSGDPYTILSNRTAFDPATP